MADYRLLKLREKCGIAVYPNSNNRVNVKHEVFETKKTSNMQVFNTVKKNDAHPVSKSLQHVFELTGRTREKQVNKENEEAMVNIIINEDYQYDLNILQIHNKMCKWFNWLNVSHIETLKNKLAEYEEMLKQPQTVIQRKHTYYQIEKCKEEIYVLENKVKYKEYCEISKPFIEAYKNLGTLVPTISFTKKINVENPVEDDEKQHKRHQIISNYLEIVRRYIPVDVIHEIKNSNKCQNCKASLENAVEDTCGNITCPNCSNEEITIKKMQVYTENKTSNTRNNYEDRENFKKAIQRFQGIQNNKPPDSLYKQLDEYFKLKNFPSATEIKQRPLLRSGQKKDTSRELMYTALHETNNSNYYEDMNLILHEYWGWALPDISHIEDRIMNDYDLTQSVYDQIPKTRKSSLNSQFRLLKHLLRYKNCISYPIRIQDFKVPTTRDIIEWHEETWEKICLILTQRGYSDWTNIPII